MYIHKKYLINNKSTDIKEYKTLLKKISGLNLRRSSKFNVLAILGALNCVDKKELSGNTGIYVCSEFASIVSVKKVLDDNEKNSMIMPFDFLNINSNNVSFYISQALESNGKNMLLTSDELSFEKGLELALFEMEINAVTDIIIGLVDESLSNINNYSRYLSNENKNYDKDYSGWLYLSQEKIDALCKIEFIKSFDSQKKLDEIIKMIDYDVFYENCEFSFIESIENFILGENKKMIYIGVDKNDKGLVFFISK